MLLRRLVERMRARDWTSVALELLVLVAGIFLGLQADDWNQKRVDRNDEQIFLTRLHEELLDSIEVRAFLRDRRMENWHAIRAALDNLMNEEGQADLGGDECRAIYNSHIKTSNIAELPSFRTLVATGRLHIISDESLRALLVRFSQQRETIERFTDVEGYQLGPSHPAFFRIQPFINVEDDRNDLDVKVTCRLAAMRGNEQFKQEFYSNADRYDAYVVSGLIPMQEIIEALHEQLDENLSITHQE